MTQRTIICAAASRPLCVICYLLSQLSFLLRFFVLSAICYLNYHFCFYSFVCYLSSVISIIISASTPLIFFYASVCQELVAKKKDELKWPRVDTVTIIIQAAQFVFYIFLLLLLVS